MVMPNVVEAVQEPVAHPGVELEARLAALPDDAQVLQVDHPAARRRGGLTTLALRQGNGGNSPTFVQFVKKMSPKERGTIALNPKSSRAHGACSREEPHPKLRARDEDRVGLQLNLAVADPVVEEKLAETASLHPLEELLGDDLIGVDVGSVQKGHVAFDDLSRGRRRLIRCRRSDPPWAAAAAIPG